MGDREFCIGYGNLKVDVFDCEECGFVIHKGMRIARTSLDRGVCWGCSLKIGYDRSGNDE